MHYKSRHRRPELRALVELFHLSAPVASPPHYDHDDESVCSPLSRQQTCRESRTGARVSIWFCVRMMKLKQHTARNERMDGPMPRCSDSSAVHFTSCFSFYIILYCFYFWENKWTRRHAHNSHSPDSWTSRTLNRLKMTLTADDFLFIFLPRLIP